MSKLSLLWVSALAGLFVVACSTEEPLPLSGPESPAGISKVRSVDEALSELDAALDQLDASTRSGERRTYSRMNVAVAGGTTATRSAGAPDLPDTLAYVVNFDRGEGFAVLGALREGTPVYAVTEQGTLDPGKLDEAIAEAYARLTKQEAAAAPETRSNPEAVRREIGIEIVPKLLAQAMVVETLSSDSGGIADWGNNMGPSSQLVDIIYGDWTNKKKVGPWVKVKWGQGYPFNMHCPETNSTYSYLSGHLYVGCVMVALGQVLATNERPVNPSVPLPPPFQSITYNWEKMKEISNYLNVKSFRSVEPKDTVWNNRHLSYYADMLATYLAYLGSEECCKAIYKEDKTSAYLEDAASTMKFLDPEFYKNVRYCSFDDATVTIYNMLDNGKPVLIGGMEEVKEEDYYFGMEVDAHVWVLDGYWHRIRPMTKVYDDGYKLYMWDNGQMLHCNWGYQGEYDGYYEEGIFDLWRVEWRDEIVDCNTPSSLKDEDLSFMNSVVVY